MAARRRRRDGHSDIRTKRVNEWFVDEKRGKSKGREMEVETLGLRTYVDVAEDRRALACLTHVAVQFVARESRHQVNFGDN